MGRDEKWYRRQRTQKNLHVQPMVMNWGGGGKAGGLERQDGGGKKRGKLGKL